MYIDGFVLPTAKDKVGDYERLVQDTADIWLSHGALEYVEAVGEDMAENGFCLSFPQMVKPEEGETVVFAYIVYTSREHRDEVNARVMADPRLAAMGEKTQHIFDHKRMAYGGFRTLVKKSAA